MGLEILRANIKTYLKTGFVQLLKFLVGALILFNKKLDSNFCLFVNYQGSDNLTIKNQYFLLLIGK